MEVYVVLFSAINAAFDFCSNVINTFNQIDMVAIFSVVAFLWGRLVFCPHLQKLLPRKGKRLALVR